MRFAVDLTRGSPGRLVTCSVVASALMLGGIGTLGSAVASGQPTADSGVMQSLPSDYIANYGGRAKPCRGLVTPPWVSWLSYASATVSDEWRVYASSPALCNVARGTADAVITAAPFNDGAGKVLTLMLAFGLHHHSASLQEAPRPAGRRWTCGVLPSFWGQQAWDLARIAHHTGAPLPTDFAAASGAAAGAGYCETQAKLDSASRWRGGKFLSWTPDTLSCQARYKLKEIPDPNNPGQTTSPPFPAELWGDYDRSSC